MMQAIYLILSYGQKVVVSGASVKANSLCYIMDCKCKNYDVFMLGEFFPYYCNIWGFFEST